MRHPTRIGRLGMLAAGLGIGAALACTPGVALADSSTGLTPTELADLDQLLRFLFDPTGADMQISIGGMDLFPTEGNTATAVASTGDIAIAIGDGSSAYSGDGLFGLLGGGTGDFVLADGTDSSAEAAVLGSGDLDFVVADGTASEAQAGLGANLSSAIADGTGSHAQVAIGAELDAALANGTSSYADAGIGSNDLAEAFAGSSATAGGGNQDFASAVGGGVANAGGFSTTASANGANTDAVTSGISDTASAYGTNAASQADGIDDVASVINTGSAFDEAIAGGGAPLTSNFDLAEIFGTGSTAVAGEGGSLDLAAVFGDMLNAMASFNYFVIDILPSL
jgi:hypothetical protein